MNYEQFLEQMKEDLTARFARKLEQLTAQVAEKLSPNADRPRARAAGMEK